MKIIDGKNMQLGHIERSDVIEHLTNSGIVLFRNFNVDVEKFSTFIGNVCSKVTSDPARVASAENTQLIESGEMEMGLHLENGNAPFMPDLQFFYCDKSPLKLSRTTYCDGAEAYKLLDPKTATYLADRQIMYTRDVHISKWKMYFQVELQREINDISDITSLLPNNVQLIVKDESYIQWRVRRNIIFNSALSQDNVLAHCIYGPSLNYEIPCVTWSDGSMIQPDILNKIGNICDQLTRPIPYQDGDVVILDNHRVMHGREKILDNNRKIYGGQGYL